MNKFDELFKGISLDADCLLITSDINRLYFTGLKSSAGILVCFRQKSFLIIDFRYIEKAMMEVKSCEVLEQKNLTEQLSELFHKYGVEKVAVESMDMTLHKMDLYEKRFPDVEFIKDNNLSNTIYEMRTIKSEAEIEKIKSAQRIAEKAFNQILNFIKPGITEHEITLALNDAMFKAGAEALAFETIVLSGSNTSMPHGVPGNKKICLGDFVLMDFGAVVEGYHSDMTRTICVGQPTEKMKNVYNIVLKAQQKALKKVCSGISGAELDHTARCVIEKAGYGKNFGHSLGHGVGLEIHEYPNASQSSEKLLDRNMILTIEPGIYIPGEFGVRIEDFVVVTENSCENLTKSPKNLIIL